MRLLLLRLRPDAIAQVCNCGVSTVYYIESNMFTYGSPYRPSFHPLGAPRKVSVAVENDMMEYLGEYPWAMQNELVWFLWEEWGVNVHRSTVSRVLKRRKGNQKKAQRIRERQNSELRLGWRADMLRLIAEQLVFLDESLFNETTGKW